jgi:hypothetical protein
MMRVKIRQPSPSYAEIELNGVQVEDAVRGLTVTMRAGHLPELELDPVVEDVSLDADQAQVYVSAAARHLLIMMGWTPPEVERGPVPDGDQDRDEAPATGSAPGSSD